MSYETAVSEYPYNPEIRFLRLSVQQNAPGFLGYNDQIEMDRNFLMSHLDGVHPRSLRKRIEELADR